MINQNYTLRFGNSHSCIAWQRKACILALNVSNRLQLAGLSLSKVQVLAARDFPTDPPIFLPPQRLPFANFNSIRAVERGKTHAWN